MSNSHEAVAWAIKVSRGEPMPARMLLIVGLASRIGGSGSVVWPSVGQIADDTDMSRASVQRWMRHLEDKGLVERFVATRSNGATSSNRYRLPIKSVFYHPTKGAILSEAPTGDDDENLAMARKVGPHVEARVGPHVEAGGASLVEAGGASPVEACSEQSFEQPLEGRDPAASAADELDLGLPPVPPKDPTVDDLAVFIGEEWATRAHATPLRGGAPTLAAAEKAMKLAKPNVLAGETVLDVWREIFLNIDGSDFLQGKVAGRDGRPPFKLTLSFLLEKRNFEKTLEGRFNGQSTGDQRRGSTSEATGRVLQRLRSRRRGSAGGGDPRRAIASH